MDLAGIEPGDILLEVDGRELSLGSVAEGPAGTSASFLIRGAGSDRTETIKITRVALEYTPLGRSTEAPVPVGVEYPPLSAQSSIESTGGVEVRRGWAVQVVSVVPNATDMLLARWRSEGLTPDPPEEGKQYFMATIRGKYIGEGSDGLDTGDFDAGGDATKRVYEAGCGDRFTTTIPNAFPSRFGEVEVLPGGVIEGAICWEIDSRDAPALKMRLDEQFYIARGGLGTPEIYYRHSHTVWYELSPMP